MGISGFIGIFGVSGFNGNFGLGHGEHGGHGGHGFTDLDGLLHIITDMSVFTGLGTGFLGTTRLLPIFKRGFRGCSRDELLGILDIGRGFRGILGIMSSGNCIRLEHGFDGMSNSLNNLRVEHGLLGTSILPRTTRIIDVGQGSVGTGGHGSIHTGGHGFFSGIGGMTMISFDV